MYTIKIKSGISKPKYIQILEDVENAILSGRLKQGGKLPSLNKTGNDCKVSRDTVLKAFRELQSRGIIESVTGKGYFVTSINPSASTKVFLLLDEFSCIKENFYDSLTTSLGRNVRIHTYFHNFKQDTFNELIEEHAGRYSHYIIMLGNWEKIGTVLEKLPKDKVYLIGQTQPKSLHYSGIYQDFERNIQYNLQKILHTIKKYEKLILVFHDNHPNGIIKGFINFCKEYSLKNEVIASLNNKSIKEKELYFVPNNKNMMQLLKKIKKLNFTLSKEVGIISYNDTALNEFIEGGISSIFVDYDYLGSRLSQMILNSEKSQIQYRSELIYRNSF